MTMRSHDLQAVIDAAQAAFAARATDPASRDCQSRAFAALADAHGPSDLTGERLPVCDHWLPTVLDTAGYPEDLRRLIEAFRAVEPAVSWQRRGGPTPSASHDFAEGHANAVLVGANGIEPRDDVWLGASLLAPGVRYPDHTHPPEEVYLVLGPGQFSQENGPWFEPGLGGTFYNRPGILHAMQATSEPLFAFWLLRADST